ncbi:MAG: hypothetical protein LJE56_06865 [Acidiferrobacterales bacterium]|jgi:hypothetical protein|nr:hypothetical protein [Acidiferrobacterales bacterium]
MIQSFPVLAVRFVAIVLGMIVVPAMAQSINEEGFGMPALMIISHPQADPDDEGRRVRPIVGIVKPKEPLGPRTKWRILPGTVFPSYRRIVGSAKVKLYTDEGPNRRLLCAITVRYFRNRQGQWQPYYRLDSDTLIIFRGNAWGPLNPVADEYNLLFQTNTRPPNGQGFYEYLDLESSAGPVTINSWIFGRGIDY